MGRPFKYKRGALVAKLNGQERRILLQLCDEVERLLEEPDADAPQWARELGLGGVGQERPAPADPVVARLLPPGYDDDKQAGEFRRFTESDLRARKMSNAATVRDDLAGDPIVISDHEMAWLAFLADCRLILGTRLGVTEEDTMWPSLDPQKNLFVYLAYLQQELVETLQGE